MTLPDTQLRSIQERLYLNQRLTKVLATPGRGAPADAGPPIALLISELDTAFGRSRQLAWIGNMARYNTPGPVDTSVTIDPLRECRNPVQLDGEKGLLSYLPLEAQEEFDRVSVLGSATRGSRFLWSALEKAIREKFAELVPLLDWMLAQANPVVFDSRDPADRAWQEQQDAARHLVRIADFPASSLNAWRRPEHRDDPYLAGIIPHPSEQSLIEHDVRASARAFGLDSDWLQGHGARCDIHVLWDKSGRRLEITNVNALELERRTGADLIYYHVPTQSFVLVQYKRLERKQQPYRVDRQLLDQLERLEAVNQLSRTAERPHEWRFGDDACFLKLAYWPENGTNDLAPGMYLPVSYVQLLLKDDSTRGPRMDANARLLGYDTVDRHLVGAQFVELVKHGLVGTVGTSREQLKTVIRRRVEEGRNVVAAFEYSKESVRARQQRHRSRDSKDRTYVHQAYRQEALFDSEP